MFGGQQCFSNYSSGAEDTMNQYSACLGIDWADKKHDLCLLDTATGKKSRLVLPHTPQAINEYFTGLRARYPGQQIAVGLEQSRGQIAKGKGRQAAVRALAYKWIRIIWKCWQTRTPYNEVKYLECLRKKGSPLLSYAAKNAA
jgi:hypothetical protein